MDILNQFNEQKINALRSVATIVLNYHTLAIFCLHKHNVSIMCLFPKKCTAVIIILCSDTEIVKK